ADDSEIRLPAEDRQTGPFLIPRDLAVFPSRAGGAIDRAVVLARRRGVQATADDPDVLLVLDLAGGKILGRCTVGPFRYNLRGVRASPAGKYVAVADADNRQVLVFAIVDIIDGKKALKPQPLRGVGAGFKAASFRRKGDALGLSLEEDGGGRMV